MTKKDRWLTSIALVASVMPLIFIAFMLKILPTELTVKIVDIIGAEPETITKYNNLIVGLFSAVPLFIVLTSRYLKGKLLGYRNYTAILGVSIVLSLSFFGIVLYGMIVRFEFAAVKNFDIMGLIAVLIAMTLSLLSTITRYRKFGSRFAINNRFTRQRVSIWKTVHNNMSTIQGFFFLGLSVVLAFLSGILSFIFLFVGIVIFSIACLVYSYLIKQFFEQRKKAVSANL